MQVVAPAYSAISPSEPVKRSAEVIPVSQVFPELERLVVEAFVAKVEEAIRENGEVALSQKGEDDALTFTPA